MSRVFWKDIFAGLSIKAFENKLIFVKKAVRHTTTVTHCKARQVLRDLFSTNKRNGSEVTFRVGATKFNLKNLKTQ